MHNTDMGGYIRNMGMAVQKRKESIFNRMMLEGGNTQKALDGLLLRQIRGQTVQDHTIDHSTPTYHTPSES